MAKNTKKAKTEETKVVKGLTRGPAPKVERTVVYVKGVGHMNVPTDSLFNKNFEPARTGDRKEDFAALQAFRKSVRKDIAAVNKANSKRTTIFDAVKASGNWDFKHPHDAAKRIVKMSKDYADSVNKGNKLASFVIL